MKPLATKWLTKLLSRTLRTPPYLILFVSDTCWMKCRHCWFNEQWKSAHLESPTLTFDELVRIAGSIDRLSFLSMTGGEAFEREDIVEIGAMFARKTRLGRYQIPTSGFLPDVIVPRAEALLEANPGIPFRVDVSMDGTEEVHESIRRIPGGHRMVLETVRRLNKLRQRHPNFDVGIITTLSQHNQHCVHEMAALAESANPGGEWMVNAIRGSVRDPRAAGLDVARYQEAHELIESRIESGRMRGHRGHAAAGWLSAKNATRRKVIASTLAGTERGGGCAAGALAGVIYSDGRFAPCEMLDLSLGNVRDFDYDLAAMWNSPRADEIRAWIQDTRCHCTHECFLSVSLLIQPRHWPDLVRERLRLARGRSRRPAKRVESLPLYPGNATPHG
jgi:MoaA/NifB/PqqE/SkfB family radical SAM enzyme